MSIGRLTRKIPAVRARVLYALFTLFILVTASILLKPGNASAQMCYYCADSNGNPIYDWAYGRASTQSYARTLAGYSASSICNYRSSDPCFEYTVLSENYRRVLIRLLPFPVFGWEAEIHFRCGVLL